MQFTWGHSRACAFSSTENCIEAALAEIVRIEECSYLRAYFDTDAPREVLEVIDRYEVELFNDDDKYEPYHYSKLYIHRTPGIAAVDRRAEAIKTLAGVPPLIEGDVYVISLNGVTYQ